MGLFGNDEKKKEEKTEYCAECGAKIGRYYETTCCGGDNNKFCDDRCLCRYERKKYGN